MSLQMVSRFQTVTMKQVAKLSLTASNSEESSGWLQ